LQFNQLPEFLTNGTTNMKSCRIICLLLAIVSSSVRAFSYSSWQSSGQNKQCTTSKRFMSMRHEAPELAFLQTEALKEEDYVAYGLSCCYELSEGNKLDETYVAEPLTAGTLECIEGGAETSYKRVLGLTCGQIFTGDCKDPTGINMGAIQILDDGEGMRLCGDAVEKTIAAARTFKRRIEAQSIAVGEIAEDFNFSTEKKRILNEVYTPSEDDNIKQDISIDVYGRTDDEEIERLANM